MQKCNEGLYSKLEIMGGADDDGKYWEIRSRGEPLREEDLVELAE